MLITKCAFCEMVFAQLGIELCREGEGVNEVGVLNDFKGLCKTDPVILNLVQDLGYMDYKVSFEILKRGQNLNIRGFAKSPFNAKQFEKITQLSAPSTGASL